MPNKRTRYLKLLPYILSVAAVVVSILSLCQARKANIISRDALILQIEELFEEKLQKHFDCARKRNNLIVRFEKGEITKPFYSAELKIIQRDLQANYEAMENLAKKYKPLGGKFDKFVHLLPSATDLKPPQNVKIKTE